MSTVSKVSLLLVVSLNEPIQVDQTPTGPCDSFFIFLYVSHLFPDLLPVDMR